MTQEALSSYQARSGINLPREYVEFISISNGGICKGEPIKLDGGPDVICDCLFGFGLKQELDFEFWQNELEEDLPKYCAAIGSSPGGGFFLLMKYGIEWQVWFYDHSYSFDGSNDLNNTYRCKISFGGLLKLVDRPFNA